MAKTGTRTNTDTWRTSVQANMTIEADGTRRDILIIEQRKEVKDGDKGKAK